MNLEHWLPLAVLAACCTIGGWLDATQRRLPNWLSLVTAGLGLVSAVVLGGAGALGTHALHMAIALAGGLALFAAGGIGGGDAKFYAGAAAWFPLGAGAGLLGCVALAGLVLLIVWFTYRRLRGIPIRKTTGTKSDSLPYGLAIGVGAVLAAAL